MTVYIVWCYDDGLLGVFSNRESAEKHIQFVHERNYYHEEDCMIKEAEVKD
jgi:hypothetical protein